jgi:acetolactate synthase-1/2/3 large subunit
MVEAGIPTAPAGAALVAEWLVRRGVDRVFGLCGGHVQPIWDELARRGVRVIDVRHECAAVYMAHAHAELTGEVGVVLVTAGPGLTNAITGIANAAVSRLPVLVVSGRPPLPQAGMNALQDMPQADLVRPLCRRVEAVSHARHILPRLDAVWRAAAGFEGAAGPAYVDFPTDLLRERVRPADLEASYFTAPSRPVTRPAAAELEAAAALIRGARRAVVISGRGARGAEAEVAALLAGGGIAYLDTAESRGVVPAGHPAAVPAGRSKAMAEADVVITLGRRLDFQLAYGSRAVFAPDARFVRLAASADELADNRRGDAELHGDVAGTVRALVDAGAAPADPDAAWHDGLRRHNAERVAAGREREWPAGADGRMHPNTLLRALEPFVDADTIVIADGGDTLSFARVGLPAETYMDPGPLGCLGVGVPFATAAALSRPDRRVVAVIGDGAFGFTAMEIDTAVRHGAKAVFVVANNASWAIERTDQLEAYSGNLVGVELPGCRYDLLARSLGAHGEHVEDPAGLPAALERAFANAPAVVDVATTPDARSPDYRSGLAGVPDRQALVAWDEAEARALG